MTQSNEAGWQTYAQGEAANLSNLLKNDVQGQDQHLTGFKDEWMTLTAPEKASAIGELSREASSGNAGSADALRTALSDGSTANSKDLNASLKQLGFGDVTISNDDTGLMVYKAVNVQEPNGSFYHADSFGDVIAQNNPNFGDGKYYANPQAVFDEINANGLPGSVFNPNKGDGTGLGLATEQQEAAMLQNMKEKNVHSIGGQ